MVFGSGKVSVKRLMDNQDLISIIVPIYNVEKYLDRCINSIINQSYKNIEIILVNDGSTDNSLKICEKYKLIDDRVIIINKKNGGQSEARNFGINVAKGEYISFVDSDDLIHIDMYSILYSAIIKNDSDISICRYKKFNSNNIDRIIHDSIQKKKNVIVKHVNNEYALSKCLNTKRITVSAWSKLYKKDIFNEIKFPYGTEMEDWAIIVDLMLKCKKVALINKELYYYYYRSNSTMNKRFKESDLKLENIFLRNLELVDKYFPSLHNQAKTNLTAHYFYVIDKITKDSLEDRYKTEFNSMLLKLKNEFIFIIIFSKHRISRRLYYLYLLYRYRHRIS